MGSTASYHRVQASTLAALQKKPKLVERFLLGETGPGDAADRVARLLARNPRDAAGIAAQIRGGTLGEGLRGPAAPPLDPEHAKQLAEMQQKMAEQLEALNRLTQATKRRRPAEIPPAEDPPLEIGKDWGDLHLVLCGSPDPEPSPLGNAVLGGQELGPSLGYGPCRFLTPEQVELTAKALATISVDDFGARCRANARGALAEQLSNVFAQVRDYYAAAAQAKQAMLLVLG